MNTNINYQKKNRKLQDIMMRCDGVVYQNEFCKDSADVYLGKMDNHAIILNGADGRPELKYNHRKPYLVTISRWRPHKRLKDTVESFLRSSLSTTHDLVVLGEPDYVISHPSVIYKGKLDSDGCWAFINSSVYVIHLAYIDWCPNSVVESIIAGKNVMHSSTGGTKYVVRDNGIMIEDKPWDFKPIDLARPPTIDFEQTTAAYEKMLTLSPPDAAYLSIDTIADQYIAYMRKVLDG